MHRIIFRHCDRLFVSNRLNLFPVTMSTGYMAWNRILQNPFIPIWPSIFLMVLVGLNFLFSKFFRLSIQPRKYSKNILEQNLMRKWITKYCIVYFRKAWISNYTKDKFSDERKWKKTFVLSVQNFPQINGKFVFSKEENCDSSLTKTNNLIFNQDKTVLEELGNHEEFQNFQSCV